jgi:isopenicillin N synthase-like dioxygenase
MSVPILRNDELSADAIDGALREGGGFLLVPSVTAPLIGAVLAAARQLFALPREAKASLGIEHSRHFRGWSEMHNERDWREQLHLGRERPAVEGPDHLRLDGPNLWPPDGEWRRVVTAYLDAVAVLGERVLGTIAGTFSAPDPSLARTARDGYILLKMIGYHPQAAGLAPRPGVAAHVDFSWLTLTLQDSPGLEVRTPDGAWMLLEPHPEGLWVHPGELLEFASRGRYAATPHRVVNRSLEQTRVSLPLFLNPPLDAMVPLFGGSGAHTQPSRPGGEHVHRVLEPDPRRVPFPFGEAEWRRKGLNGWCSVCAPPSARRH